jgi:hypothetical protein
MSTAADDGATYRKKSTRRAAAAAGLTEDRRGREECVRKRIEEEVQNSDESAMETLQIVTDEQPAHFQIGEGRSVELALSQSKTYIVLKRHFTAEEKLRNDGTADGVSVVIEKVQALALLKYARRIRKKCDTMLEGRALQFMYSLGEDLFVRVQTSTSTIHIRRYWYQCVESEWKATKCGVTMVAKEMLKLLSILPDLTDQLVHEDTEMSSSDSD